jgi:hypothetical protein
MPSDKQKEVALEGRFVGCRINNKKKRNCDIIILNLSFTATLP